MSAATAIAMASESLRNLLLADLATLTPPVGVTVLRPDEGGTDPRVNLYLYKVDENPALRNQDWQLKPGSATRLMPPPLSLNLHYLVTGYATNDPQTGNTTAQEVLGEAMRIFHEHPVVPTQHLVPGLREAREQLKVMLGTMDWDTLVRVWGTFSQPYRPSVTYEVSVVRIDMLDAFERDMVARVRSIGAPRVQAPYLPPMITGIAPVAGPPGTGVRVSGRNLSGWKGYATLMRRRILDAGDIADDAFDVVIPMDQPPGPVELRIDISHLAHATFLFEVT